MANSIHFERRGARVAYQGDVDFNELLSAVMTIHENPDYDRIEHVLHDMRGVHKLDFSGVDMTTLASLELGAKLTNPRCKVAIASEDPTMETMVGVFAHITQREIRQFSTVETALEWLGAAAV